MTDETFYAKRFIRIGVTVINPNQIVEVLLDDETGEVKVYEVSQGNDVGTIRTFSGKEAEAVRSYFIANSEDLLQSPVNHDVTSADLIEIYDAVGKNDKELPF